MAMYSGEGLTTISNHFRMFHATKPKVIGILDWEMSTIGHPLADLANFTTYWYSTSGTSTTKQGLVDQPRPLDIPEVDVGVHVACWL